MRSALGLLTLSFDGGAPTPAALALLQRYLDLAIAALGPEAQLPTSHWPLDPGHEQRP